MAIEEETINNQTFCRECGESIDEESKFCPECGANQGSPAPKSDETENGFLSSLNKYELIVITGSLFMFVAAAFPWATNPLGSATGTQVGYGYFGLFGSIIIVSMLFFNVIPKYQGTIFGVIGIIVALLTFHCINWITSTSDLYVGFGCILSLIGAIIIIWGGLRLEDIAKAGAQP